MTVGKTVPLSEGESGFRVFAPNSMMSENALGALTRMGAESPHYGSVVARFTVLVQVKRRFSNRAP